MPQARDPPLRHALTKAPLANVPGSERLSSLRLVTRTLIPGQSGAIALFEEVENGPRNTLKSAGLG